MKRFWNWTLSGYVALMLAVSAPAVGQYVTQTLGPLAYVPPTQLSVVGTDVGINTASPSTYLFTFHGLAVTDPARAALTLGGAKTGSDGSFADLMFFNSTTRSAILQAQRVTADDNSELAMYVTNGGSLTEPLRLGYTGVVKFGASISRVTANTSRATTTLVNINGLTATVAAARHYTFRAVLQSTPDVTGGTKVAISGTATATNIVYTVKGFNISTPEVLYAGQATALDTAVGGAGGTAHLIEIEGTITVNAAGTLTVQAAQNAASGSSSILRGSTFTVWETN